MRVVCFAITGLVLTCRMGLEDCREANFELCLPVMSHIDRIGITADMFGITTAAGLCVSITPLDT